MMLSKSLVSFIVASAVATGVSAAATPIARGGSQCNVGSVSCCNATFTKNDPFLASLSGLLGGIPLNVGALLGLNCVGILGSTQCNTSPVCCENVNQSGLINLGCSPLNIGL